MSAREKFRDMIEPDAASIDGMTALPYHEIAIISLAISAKRIADLMQKETSSTSGEYENAQQGYSVEEFCRAHSFSKAHYFNLKKAGLHPQEVRYGNKIIITRQAAADWRRDCERRGNP